MNRLEVGAVVRVDVGYDIVHGKVIRTLQDDDISWVMVILPDGSAWVGEADSDELKPLVH